jgi:peptidoglycan/LPS O-acetylase OafA/YrhL
MLTDAAVLRYQALDGLRGIAALTVCSDTLACCSVLFSVPNGLLAVDTFFAMGGFVIARAHRERRHHGMSPWTYLYPPRRSA